MSQQKWQYKEYNIEYTVEYTILRFHGCFFIKRAKWRSSIKDSLVAYSCSELFETSNSYEILDIITRTKYWLQPRNKTGSEFRSLDTNLISTLNSERFMNQVLAWVMSSKIVHGIPVNYFFLFLFF